MKEMSKNFETFAGELSRSLENIMKLVNETDGNKPEPEECAGVVLDGSCFGTIIFVSLLLTSEAVPSRNSYFLPFFLISVLLILHPYST